MDMVTLKLMMAMTLKMVMINEMKEKNTWFKPFLVTKIISENWFEKVKILTHDIMENN